MGSKLDQTLAVLNGLVGDYLATEQNGLATTMACYHHGAPLAMTPAAIAQAYPNATGRVALLVHGLMSNETVWRFPDGSDYGQRLSTDMGITPLYLRYNSGAPIADNGAELATLIDVLLDAYPRALEELILIGYSMGGLLVRSACHVATDRGLPWLRRVRTAIYVGTPHLGAPAERVGRVVAKLLHAIPDPYTRLIGDIGDLRSAGIKDLGHADLRHEDRTGQAERLSLRDARHPVPLLPEIRHALVAGSLSLDSKMAGLFGDAVVPVKSATAQTLLDVDSLAIPSERVRILPGRSHLDLTHDGEVYELLQQWCE